MLLTSNGRTQLLVGIIHGFLMIWLSGRITYRLHRSSSNQNTVEQRQEFLESRLEKEGTILEINV